ncbi:MAG: RNA polymerase sigma factor [Thermodesulfobacteriota bacterium]
MGKLLRLLSPFFKPDDFETILSTHLTKLHRVAYRLTRRAEDAEDLVHDVIVKLYPKRDEICRLEKPGPWLVKVLYRTFIDQRRRAGRSPLSLVLHENDNDGSTLLDQVATEENNPERLSENSQLRDKLLAAIHSLNPDQQHLCILHDMEGYTLAELEEILETPIGTLKSRLHRARANLRKFLEQETFLSG